MKQYKIRPEGLKELYKQTLFKLLLTYFLIIVAVSGIFYFQGNMKNESITNLIIIASLPIAILIFNIFRVLKKTNLQFESYELIIDEESITREQLDTPTVRIPKSEVSEITKNYNGGFTIKGSNKEYIIGVPVQIELIDELGNTLSEIKPFVLQEQKPLLKKLNTPILILSLLTMGIFYASFNKIVIGICGLLLISGIIWSVYIMRKNKGLISDKARKTLWFMYLWILFLVVVKLYNVFFA